MEIKANSLFEALMELYPFPIVLSDTENRYVFVNDSFVKAINHKDTSTILGKTPQELGIKINPTLSEGILHEILKKGAVYNIQITTDELNSKTSIFSSKLINPDNRQLILTATVDISDRIKLERELESCNENLESVVVERTNELEQLNIELKQRVEEINLANENLDRLVKERTNKINSQYNQLLEYMNINSHEVRAPLARILGLIKIMQLTRNEDSNDLLEKLDFSALELDLIVRRFNRQLEQALE